MSEGSPAREAGQARGGFVPTVADGFTALRLPLALLFLLLPATGWRVAILLTAGGTDLLDGFLARRYGSSRLGAFLDPVADKLFVLAACSVVLRSGALSLPEVAGVMLRDLLAAGAFLWTAFSGRPSAIPARPGGKAVTLLQTLTLLAFVLESPYLRPLAWATAAVGLYAVWDYSHAARQARRL